MKAIWNEQVIAESDETVVIENNHYFPEDSIKKEFFEKNSHSSHCPWKGDAAYYDINVGGNVNRSGAWYYPEPKEAAKVIKNHVAFWNGIKITE
jgi:uncharacterized protein (DUF427 family)